MRTSEGGLSRGACCGTT